MTAALLQRVYGNDDLFPDDRLHAYHAYQSVNYVTSHDGLTLYDLVSYSKKRNIDGPVENYSSNSGREGEEATPVNVLSRRELQAKNFIALLMLPNGTPMLRAGDEFLQTQHGHNNPCDLDDETTWLNWRRREHCPGYWRFVQKMIAFRKQHPSLARSRFWREDIRWFGPRGVADFSQPAVAWCLHETSQGDRDLYVIVNAGYQPVTFVLQDTTHPWRVAVDTSRPSPDDIELEHPPLLERPSYMTASHSVVVLVAG